MDKGSKIQTRMNSIQRIGLIGTGNIAQALGRAWLERGIEIAACYNRKQEPLHWNGGLKPVASPAEMPDGLDAILVATSDDAVFEIIDALPAGPLAIHFSGALPLPKRPGAAIWPIQSVRKENVHSRSSFPLVLNATDDAVESRLIPFAEKIASELHCLSTEKRQAAHLAAVFASNFSNHSLSIAQSLTAQTGLPWSTFQPILKTIMEQGALGHSFAQQTGPALRRESSVIESQRKALNNDPLWLAIYDAMTQSIQETHPDPTTTDSQTDPSHESHS
jgi:predicted short-subunit dehydrogenase-like oxidoreductase (DUF2520 family)